MDAFFSVGGGARYCCFATERRWLQCFDICRVSGDAWLTAKNKNIDACLRCSRIRDADAMDAESLVRKVWLFPFRAREQGVECDERYLGKYKLPGTAAGTSPDSAMRRQPKAKNLAFSCGCQLCSTYIVLHWWKNNKSNCIVSLSLYSKCFCVSIESTQCEAAM